MFTKRHYEWMARAFAEANLTESQVLSLTDALCRDNYNFNALTFLAAFRKHVAARLGKPPVGKYES